VTSESIPGWAFLVARGRQTGYQLLLAPDFIMTGREAALLMDEVRGEVPMQGPPMVTDIAGPVSGPLCMVYRTVRATRGDVGAADRPEEPLLDRAGRPLVLTYGFICRGSRVVAPHDQDLRVARDAAVATYRRFHAAEETFPPETSRPYSVQSTVVPAEAALSGPAAPRPAAPAEPALSWPAASRSPAPWTSQTLPGSQQPALVRRRPAIVISLIAVVALFGLALGAYVLTHGRQAKPHRCVTSETTAKPSPGTCGRSKPQSTRPPTKSPPASSRASFGKKAPGVIAAWERPAAIRRFLEFDVASPQGPSTPPTIESINFQHPRSSRTHGERQRPGIDGRCWSRPRAGANAAADRQGGYLHRPGDDTANPPARPVRSHQHRLVSSRPGTDLARAGRQGQVPRAARRPA
jgi:hypothetical protein